MKSRIAALILAHRPEALPYLASLLPSPFDIFIHYDAKAGALPNIALPNLRFITPRRPVFWGGFSMVQATLDLLQAAMKADDYERYVLISGDSLPLRSTEALAARLLLPKVEYIQLTELADVPATAGKTLDEIKAIIDWEHPGRFYNFQNWDSILTNPYTEAAVIADCNGDLPEAQRRRSNAVREMAALLACKPPRPRLFAKFYYGAQWWALSADLIAQILPQLLDPQVQDFFRFMEVPDEHYFNCVIGNCRDELEAAGHSISNSHMLSDHAAKTEGRVSVSSAMLHNAARTSQWLFMRKFNPIAAPDMADAIRTGRYQQDILGV